LSSDFLEISGKNNENLDMTVSGLAIVGRIDILLKAKNLKRVAACEAAGIDKSSMSDWIRHDTIPAGDILFKIADFLGVSARWLLTGEDDQHLTARDQELIRIWQDLDDLAKKHAEAQIKEIYAHEEELGRLRSQHETPPFPLAPKILETTDGSPPHPS
jgi:transcriptional regulator with XRE-family HTH domain